MTKKETALSNGASRIEVIDFLRGFSILAVLAAHSGGIGQSMPFTLLNQLWMRFVINGSYGVSIFFVISGYVITRMIVLRNRDLSQLNIKDFYVRRIARLWPLLGTLVLLLAVLGLTLDPKMPGFTDCLQGMREKSTPLFLLAIPTFMLNWFFILAPAVYGHCWGVMWSLAVEEQFYFFYPFFLKLFFRAPKIGGYFFAAFIILLGPAARFLEHLARPDAVPVFINSFGAFDQMALGALLFFTSEKVRPQLMEKPRLKLVIFAAGILVFGWTYVNCFFYTPNLQRILAPTLFALGVWGIVLGGDESPIFKNFAARAVIFIGQLSYGIYLIHYLIIFFLTPWLPGFWTAGSFLSVTIITAAIAWLSYRFLEEPSRRLIIDRFNLKAAKP